ncbi:MAG: ABC transporter substrate-binding protein [Myxococcaceae bacterium]|nr:ABC transporter substrate-binding protein [Myxococcaceae bacterium]
MSFEDVSVRPERSRRGARWCFAVVSLLLLACTRGTPKPQKLTVYCSVQLEWCEAIAKSFQQTTGITVSMTRKSAGETLAQVTAERRNPRGDVWFGGTGDAHLQAAEALLTEPYPSPRLNELHAWAVDPAGDHRTTGVYLGALGYTYSRDWLARKGLTSKPTTWAALLDPKLEGEVQVANPSSSGTAYTLLATWVQLFGEEQAFTFLKALDKNVSQYTLSGAAGARAAARGEAGIGIVFLHDAMTEKLAGYPLELVVPEEGTGYEIGCVSIIHGARHPESAKAFVDWALSKEAQELGEKARSHQWPSNATAAAPKAVLDLSAVKLIELDLHRFGKKTERARLLARWENEVRGGR